VAGLTHLALWSDNSSKLSCNDPRPIPVNSVVVTDLVSYCTIDGTGQSAYFRYSAVTSEQRVR